MRMEWETSLQSPSLGPVLAICVDTQDSGSGELRKPGGTGLLSKWWAMAQEAMLPLGQSPGSGENEGPQPVSGHLQPADLPEGMEFQPACCLPGRPRS